MIRIGFFSEPTNPEVITYKGLYGGSFLFDYIKLNKEFEKLIYWFFDTSKNRLDIEYNENNVAMVVELYHKLKKEKWLGNLRIFTDDKFYRLDFSFLGYDVGADSMYYSPLGDGFLLKYNASKDFFQI